MENGGGGGGDGGKSDVPADANERKTRLLPFPPVSVRFGVGFDRLAMEKGMGVCYAQP